LFNKNNNKNNNNNNFHYLTLTEAFKLAQNVQAAGHECLVAVLMVHTRNDDKVNIAYSLTIL